MSLRINHNISAMNSHRNLSMNSAGLSKSLERLSSGSRINRASDGPASLVISEQMRAQIAGLDQAIRNSETAVSMVQTTESALAEVNNLLVGVRQLAIHASNEGANDSIMLAADQEEASSALANLDRIARTTQFGTLKLLDGSNGANGVATGNGVEFVSADTTTGDSGSDGFNVEITQNATKARIMGAIPLTLEAIQKGETFEVFEAGKVVSYTAVETDTVETALQNLQAKLNDKGLKVDISLDEGRMVLEHQNYGSDFDFKVSSSSAGILSENAGEFINTYKGVDVRGFINGESALGEGQVLSGIEGGTSTSGLNVRFTEQADLRPRSLSGELLGKSEGLLAKNREGMVVEVGGDGQVHKLDFPDKEGNLIISRLSSGAPVMVNIKELSPQATIKARIVNLNSAGLLEKNLDQKVKVGTVHIAQNSVKFQIGGNKGQTTGVSLLNVSSVALARGVKTESNYNSLEDIDLMTFKGAQDALLMVDEAINEISAQRATLGSIQKNNLENNMNSLKVTHESLTSAESVLRDADMASEMATFTKNKIMTQAATAMLAQANQVPQNILSLLNG